MSLDRAKQFGAAHGCPNFGLEPRVDSVKAGSGRSGRSLRALDLFCCAGGASVGIHRAGFTIAGVDIAPQPRYPFEFRQGDALDADLTGVDFVWASPPCQRHTRLPTGEKSYACHIEATRQKLLEWGGPWIMENVAVSPLLNAAVLCGGMFGLRTYRHRLFESSHLLLVPPHPRHTVRASKAGHYEAGTFISVAGNCAPMSLAREAMGIDWMTRAELTEAVPPAYSEFLCRQIVESCFRVGGGGAEQAGDENRETKKGEAPNGACPPDEAPR